MVVVGLVARLRIVGVLWFYLFIFLFHSGLIELFLVFFENWDLDLFSTYFELPNMVFVKKIVFENRKYLLNNIINQDSREKVYRSMWQKRLVQGELMQDPTIVVFRLIALIVESLFESNSCPR